MTFFNQNKPAASIPLRQLSNELSQIAVTYRSPVELTVSSDNLRVHTPRQIKQIARSISVFGFLIPIIIDEASQVLSASVAFWRHANSTVSRCRRSKSRI